MTYSLVLWAFLFGFASHETQGTGGVSVVTFNFGSEDACQQALKKAEKSAKLGTDPYASYQIVGQCIAHEK